MRIAVRAQGVRDPQQLAAWMTNHARRLNLAGKARSVGPRYLRAQLLGPVDRVSALVTAMHSGSLSQRPDFVRTTPTAGRMPGTFEETA